MLAWSLHWYGSRCLGSAMGASALAHPNKPLSRESTYSPLAPLSLSQGEGGKRRGEGWSTIEPCLT
jgi:hypothetical protein